MPQATPEEKGLIYQTLHTKRIEGNHSQVWKEGV